MKTHPLIVAIVLVGMPAVHLAARGQTAQLPPPQASAAQKPDIAAKPDAAKKSDTAKTPDAAEKPADTSDGRCDSCGSCVCVRKVCVPKPKEREIKKVCWSYRCEDFCVPGPSESCGAMCRKDRCGCWWQEIWKPTWAEIRTKKVPVKTEVTRKVPGFEWKPEERCAACRARGDDATCAAGSSP